MAGLKSALISPVLCFAALTSLTACAASPQAPGMASIAPQIPAGSQDLIGSTPRILDAEFGQPTLLRVDGTAQVWLYHSAACGLNLFLYPDASGVPRVTMATTADGSPAIGDCPASLQQSHIDAVINTPATAALRGPASAGLEPPAAS